MVDLVILSVMMYQVNISEKQCYVLKAGVNFLRTRSYIKPKVIYAIWTEVRDYFKDLRTRTYPENVLEASKQKRLDSYSRTRLNNNLILLNDAFDRLNKMNLDDLRMFIMKRTKLDESK
jgi:hypothetical protein